MSGADHDRRVVRAFLVRCRAWGTDREIPSALARLAGSPSSADAAKLHRWTSWVEFVDHALGELDRGELDGWFGGVDDSPTADGTVAGRGTPG